MGGPTPLPVKVVAGTAARELGGQGGGGVVGCGEEGLAGAATAALRWSQGRLSGGVGADRSENGMTKEVSSVHWSRWAAGKMLCRGERPV